MPRAAHRLKIHLFRPEGDTDGSNPLSSVTEVENIFERTVELIEPFYAPPFLDMHNRMKEVLALLGRLPRIIERPPLCRATRLTG
jgi:hypothetical protein